MAEVSGQWPEQEASVFVKMLRKPAGGLRTLFRIIGKARAREVKKWFGELIRDFPEVNIAPMRWVSDATY